MDQGEFQSQGRGRNQHALRDYNERLILTTLSRQGQMPGSEISRITALSPQTVSVILRQLEQDGMLVRLAPNRGRVGKPSVPMALAPDGAFSIGMKIGRRSVSVVLTDLVGQIMLDERETYDYPMPGPIMTFCKDILDRIRVMLGSKGWSRVAGIGVAKPYQIWAWHDSVGASEQDLAEWKDFDFTKAFADICDLQVFVENDATAASQAEQIRGVGRDWSHYAYFFVGTFVGGGVILNDAVFDGPFGNAGAFGSLPVISRSGEVKQLIDTASLHLLERQLRANGTDPSILLDATADWTSLGPVLETWIDETARELAMAALTVSAVVDFEAVVVDGSFPSDIRSRLVHGIDHHLNGMDMRGLKPPRIVEGTIGPNARALGAAAYPIQAKHFLAPHAD